MTEKTGYVYKYVDNNDGIVKYVGLVNPGNSLSNRIKQHKRDKWYHNQFSIYYTEVATKTDCEFLESHFIAYYHSDEYFNKAKSNWGESKFDVSIVDWKKFDQRNEPEEFDDFELFNIDDGSVCSLTLNEIKYLYTIEKFKGEVFKTENYDMFGDKICAYELSYNGYLMTCKDIKNNKYSHIYDYIFQNKELEAYPWYPVNDIYDDLYTHMKSVIAVDDDREFTFDEILHNGDNKYSSTSLLDTTTVEIENGKVKRVYGLKNTSRSYDVIMELLKHKKYKYTDAFEKKLNRDTATNIFVKLDMLRANKE